MKGFEFLGSRRALGHVAFAAVGAIAVSLASPGAAQQNPVAAPSALVTNGADLGGASAPAPRRNRAGERRICVDDAPTGTRIPRRICKTEGEWEAAGGLDYLDR